MLKKKKDIAKITISRNYTWIFFTRYQNIDVHGYFGSMNILKKVLKLELYDKLGLLPDLKLNPSLSEVTIESKKRKIILHDLELIHPKSRYEPYYTFMVNGETEVLKWKS